jgi:hypothetical protein
MPSIQEFLSVPGLLMLAAANATPVIVARVLGTRYSAPIDGNRLLRDQRPLFGSHKTWRGLIAGILTTGATGSLLATGFTVGALFGTLALAGDLLSSFIKRRLGCRSGKSFAFLDQLPEALLPMVVLRGVLELEIWAIVGTALVFTALDALTARLRS